MSTNEQLWNIILNLTLGLGGFSNSLIYFLQRKSVVEGNQHTKMEKLELLAFERSHSLDNMLCREPNLVWIDLSPRVSVTKDSILEKFTKREE